MDIVDQYQYRVVWSPEDEVFVARVAEWPWLGAHGDTHNEALEEIKSVVRLAIENCEEDGEPYQEPLGAKEFSGRFNVRMSEELHRSLALIAATQSVSLNQIVIETLSGAAAAHRALVEFVGPGTVPSIGSLVRMETWPGGHVATVREKQRRKTYMLANPITLEDGTVEAEIVGISGPPRPG